MYNTMFRQQVAGDDLYVVSFLAQPSKGHSCMLCMEAEHDEMECALASPKRDPKPSSSSVTGASRAGVGNRPFKGHEHPICNNLNHGDCMYPNCQYKHPASSAAVGHVPWCAA